MLTTNEYFDGKVVSIGFDTKEGKVTSGVMAPGEYTFSTGKAERMSVVFGSMLVKLPGSEEFKEYAKGQDYIVPAESSFDLKIEEAVAYTCEYLA